MELEKFTEYETPIGTIYLEDFELRDFYDGIRLLDSNKKLYEVLSLEVEDLDDDDEELEIKAKENYDKLVERIENIENIEDFLDGVRTFNTLFYTENIEDLYEIFGCTAKEDVLKQPETIVIGKYYILEANDADLLKYSEQKDSLVKVETEFGVIYVDNFREEEPIALYDSNKKFIWPLKWQLQIPDKYIWSWLLTQMEKKKTVKELLDWIGFKDNMLVGEHIIGNTTFQLYHKLLFQKIQVPDDFLKFIKNRKKDD